MNDSNHIRDLIDRWPTRKALADEVGANTASVHKWATTGRVPPRWQLAVIRAAQARGVAHVTAEWMIEVHARGDIDACGDTTAGAA
jgi:hypothetical protein